MTTEQKAVDLINEVCGERGLPLWSDGDISRLGSINDEAFCRAIEAIEAKDAEIKAFRMKVSEKVKGLIEELFKACSLEEIKIAKSHLSDLILPDPDPLAEALKDAGIDPDAVFKVLDAQGLRVTETGQ